MSRSLQADDTAHLVSRLADESPPFSSLGTPLLADTEVTRELVRRGSSAVPALLDGLRLGDGTVAMYAAYTLGLIGDASCIPDLLEAAELYRSREPRGEFDHGAVRESERAVERLSRPLP